MLSTPASAMASASSARGAERLGEQPHARGLAEHVDLAREAHAGLFQVAAELAVDQRDGRAIHHAVVAGRGDLFEKPRHVAGRIDAQQAGDQRAILDHVDQRALADLQRERVGVADRQIAGHRAQALHAEIGEAMRGHDVGAAARRHLGGDAGAAQRVVDGAPGGAFGAQPSRRWSRDRVSSAMPPASTSDSHSRIERRLACSNSPELADSARCRTAGAKPMRVFIENEAGSSAQEHLRRAHARVSAPRAVSRPIPILTASCSAPGAATAMRSIASC